MVKGAVLYLFLHVIGFLLTRLWGVFLILAVITTLAWAYPFACIDFYFFGGGHENTVWAYSAIFGAVTALLGLATMLPPAKRGKRRKR